MVVRCCHRGGADHGNPSVTHRRLAAHIDARVANGAVPGRRDQRFSRAVGAVAWCVLVVSGTLRHFVSRSYSEWLVWPTLSSFAVLLFVATWRWNLGRRTRARAGFRESSPDSQRDLLPLCHQSQGRNVSSSEKYSIHAVGSRRMSIV